MQDLDLQRASELSGDMFEVARPMGGFEEKGWIEELIGSRSYSPGRPDSFLFAANAELEEQAMELDLKLFSIPLSLRRQRTRFLTRLALSERHWLYEGAPLRAARLKLAEDVYSDGYVLKRIRDQRGDAAPTLAELFANGEWDLPLEERVRLARQICLACHGLECLGMAHGDLSSAHVRVGWHSEHRRVAILTDYDHFHHAEEPDLPLFVRERGLRGLGSDGYQAPFLLRRARVKAEDAVLTSDRMALAALVFEIVIWRPVMRKSLRRGRVLTRELCEWGDLQSLPKRVRSAWPQGFELLQMAFEAPSFDEMPSPRDWLSRLGGAPPRTPRLVVERSREEPRLRKEIQLKADHGVLTQAHPLLAAVGYRRLLGDRLLLEVPWKEPILRVAPQPAVDWHDGELVLQRGERVDCNYWSFELL